MNNPHNAHIAVSVRDDGIVSLKLGNPLSEEHIDELKTWAAAVLATVEEASKKQGDKVRTIVDLTGLKNYNADAISLLSELMKKTEPFVKKMATFGADSFIRIAQDTLVAMSGRNSEDYKACKTEQEALDWVRL